MSPQDARRKVWILATAATLASAAACASSEPKLDELLAGVPSEGMKERWREADAAGRLPSLDDVPRADPPVSRRSPATVSDPGQEPRRPVIPKEAVADAQAYSTVPVASYQGMFALAEAQPGRLVGQLESRRAPLEIHYKVPGEKQALNTIGAKDFRLDLVDGVEGTSLRKKIDLRKAGGELVLFYLSDGGPKPYERKFEGLALSVVQDSKTAKDFVAPVNFTYRDENFILRPGERRRADGMEFFVISSYFHPAGGAASLEGDPYHVTLMIFRPAP